MLTERELEVTLRRASGESQKTIAKALKITQGAISQFETNAQRKLTDAVDTLEFLGKKGIKVQQGTLGKRVKYGGEKK